MHAVLDEPCQFITLEKYEGECTVFFKKEKEVISNELSQLQSILKEETNSKAAIQSELTAVKAQLAEEKNKLN